MSNVIPQNEYFANNGVFTVLLAVLGVMYVLLSAYIVYVNFSSRENLKKIMLYCNSESATLTNTKVVDNIVKNCASHVNGIKIKKTRIRTDDNNGLVMTLKVNVTADTVSEPVDRLHCLLADSFQSVLGITFNSINFEVAKLASNFTPDVSKAAEQAEEIAEQRGEVADIYNEPLPNHDGETEQEQQEREEETPDPEEEPQAEVEPAPKKRSSKKSKEE